MIAFLVYLTKSGWDPTSGGWHCSALKIPGATIEALRVDGDKVSDEWYVVDLPNELVHWNHGDPPEIAVLSVALTQELTTQGKLLKWATFNPVLAAIVTAAATVIIGIEKTPSPIATPAAPPAAPRAECGSPAATAADSKQVSCYATWRITGSIDQKHAPAGYYTAFLPPRLLVGPDGIFSQQEISVRYDGMRWQFPSITFFPDSKAYQPVVVHLEDPQAAGQQFNYALHEIRLDPILFKKTLPGK
jgi:hypothetical protein